MKTRRIVIAIASAVVSSTCVLSTVIYAQSPATIAAGPVAYVDAGQVGGCSSCAQSGFTQYVRPHAHFNYSDHANPYPAGPCCRTVFGELLCDIGSHFRRVVNCQEDILAAGCDGCGVGCGEPLDCVPRLRDLIPRPWFAPVFGPGWECGAACTVEDSGTGCPSCVTGGQMMGETVESPEGWSPPVAEPDVEGADPNIPDAPAPPVESARLRAVLTPPGLTAADPYVRRSQYAQPVRGQGAGTVVPRRVKGSEPPRPEVRPAKSTTAGEAPAAQRVSVRQDSGVRSKVIRAKPLQPSTPPAPPARTIRFADQFGKSVKAPLTQASFR